MDMVIHLIKGKKYISPADLEKLTGLKYVTIKQWKNRKLLKKGIDYIELDSASHFLINIDSEFINQKTDKVSMIK